MVSKKRTVLDEHGFLALAAGTKLRFVMSPEILEYVDRFAEALRMERGRVLMATIVADKIDAKAVIFLQPGPVEAEQRTDQRGPLTLAVTVHGRKLDLRLTATQDPSAMPKGELLTVIVFYTARERERQAKQRWRVR